MVANVRKRVKNRRPRHPVYPGHQADPAASQRSCFHRDKTPEALFIQNRRHLPITFACIARMRGPNHSATLRRLIPPRESPEQNLSDPLQLRLTYLWTGPKLDFGRFMQRTREHSACGARYGSDVLYVLEACATGERDNTPI